MQVVILRGISGSGKSSYAKMLGMEIVSADHFFEFDGEYRFDPKLLPIAHRQCLRTYVEMVRKGKSVVVDNTNCSLIECAPYIAVAQAYLIIGTMVVDFHTDPQLAFNRSVHGVPIAAIESQFAAMKRADAEWPQWWPERRSV